MPSHSDRVRRNYGDKSRDEIQESCMHSWRFSVFSESYICDICYMIITQKDLVDNRKKEILESPQWDKKTADLSHIQQDIKDILK